MKGLRWLVLFLISLAMFAGTVRAATFDEWRTAHFNATELADPAISGPAADPDHDGMSNLLEYALGLDPKTASVQGKPGISLTVDRYPTLTFAQNSDAFDLTYVEVSSDLRLWQRGPQRIALADYTYLYDNWYLVTYQSATSTAQAARQFLRLTVLLDHSLPADWLQRYFSTAGALDPDADADGDGYSNFAEYLNDTDPTDFYNGSLPSLQIVAGGNQWAAPGAVLAVPFAVAVDGGRFNAPVFFSVPQGGALLAADSAGTGGWQTSITTRATEVVTSGNGNQSYAARIYVRLPNLANAVSTLRASVTTAGHTAAVSSYAVTFDPSINAPTGLLATPVDTDSVRLDWTPADATKPTTIEVSLDGGTTWVVVGTVAAGVTSATITGLPPDTKALFRVLTGGTPSADGATSFPMPAPGSSSGPGGGSSSAPTDPADATPLSQPVLIGEEATFNGTQWGFAGFQSPAHRYLRQVDEVSSTETDNDGDGGTSTTTTTYDDLKTGHSTQSTSFTGAGGSDYGGTWTIASDTSQTRNGMDDDGSGETSVATTTLSNLYATDVFKSNVESWVPDFQNQLSEGQGTAGIHLSAEPVSEFEQRTYAITKLQYQWKVNSDPNLVITWDVQFTPDDGGDVQHDVKTWAAQGDTKSPLYALDPRQLNDKKNGTYKVVRISIVPDDGVAGKVGDMVPSNNGPTGEKHFVSPKKSTAIADDYVTLKAQGPATVQFQDNYEWEGGEAVPDEPLKRRVKRDATGKTEVKIKAKTGGPCSIRLMCGWCGRMLSLHRENRPFIRMTEPNLVTKQRTRWTKDGGLFLRSNRQRLATAPFPTIRI